MSFEPPYVYDAAYKNGKSSGFISSSDVWSSGVRYQSLPADRKVFPGKTSMYGYDKVKIRNNSKSEGSTSKDSQKEPKTLLDVFVRFADTTSLQGIPFINRASRWYAKLLWVLVFLSATGAWVFHSYFLLVTYLQYETSSSVAIVYEHAAFPSVTFCNINPMRIDTLSTYGSRQLGSFMESTKPKEALTQQAVSGGPSGPPVGRRKLLAVGPNQQQQPKRNEETQSYQYSNYVNQEHMSISSSKINWTYFASLATDYQDVIEDAKASASAKTFAVFKEIMAGLPRRNRTLGGHSLSYMMLSCSYDGEECSARNFTKDLDINYGNCWTFNSEHLLNQSLKSLRGGANTGLDLVINIHEYQYLKGLNIGRGLRVHLHPFDTMSFVSTSGFSVAPGKQTYVGVRAIDQTRLGGLYGKCNDDNGQFVTYYDGAYLYTLDGCINTCLDRTISAQCRCYRKTQRQNYRQSDIQNLTHCSSFDELSCVQKYSQQFSTGSLTCGCNQACKTIDYESQVTTDSWPDETLWFSLVDAVCHRDETSCEYFQNIKPEDRDTILKKNFIHLKVYFKDLNVQKIEEKAQYEPVQFASDFGGAIGLWIGATAITVVEIFDLSCQLCTFCRRKKKYKKRKEASRNINEGEQLTDTNGVFGSNIKAKLPRTVFENSEYIPFNKI